jgi:hypothetical protein
VNPSLWLAWRFRHDSSVGSRRDSPNLYTSSMMWQIYLKMNDNLQIPNNYWYGEKQLIMEKYRKKWKFTSALSPHSDERRPSRRSGMGSSIRRRCNHRAGGRRQRRRPWYENNFFCTRKGSHGTLEAKRTPKRIK